MADTNADQHADYGCAAGHRHRTFLAAAACDEEGGTIAPPPNLIAESVLPDEDDLTHYMRAVTRLMGENKRLREALYRACVEVDVPEGVVVNHEDGTAHIDGYPPSPMDTCTRCWGADGPDHQCAQIDGQDAPVSDTGTMGS